VQETVRSGAAATDAAIILPELNLDADVHHRAPISAPSRRLPRALWPLITAAAFGVVVLAGIVGLAMRGASHSIENARGQLVGNSAKLPEKSAGLGTALPDPEVPAPRRLSSATTDSLTTQGLLLEPARNSFVRINKLKYEASHPVTFEVYIRVLSNPDHASTIMGDAAGAGIAIGISPDGAANLVAYSKGQPHWLGNWESWASLIGQRTHLAGVLSDGQLAFFVNGKRAGSLKLPGPVDRSSLPVCIGGSPSVDGNAIGLVNGIIEQIRISQSARYRADFDPDQRLAGDASTLVLYHFDEDTDDFAVDASGRGNHGWILGAEHVLVIDAPLKSRSPVADGKVTDLEYGPPLKVDFTTDRNPGRLTIVNPTGRKWSETVTPTDLSFDLYAAHTVRSLFLAIRVTDDFIDDQDEPDGQVFWNDGVELFVDGDRVPNDYLLSGGPAKRGSREGFQILADARGRQQTFSNDFTNRDWKVATTRRPDGYVVEFEIPLALIDTADGAAYFPASTGSFLWFDAAVTDNDSPVHGQQDYGSLWLAGPAGTSGRSPAMLGEKGWRVGLSLSGPRPGSPDADHPNGMVRRIYRGTGSNNSLALSSDGRVLVSGNASYPRSGTIHSWDLTTGQERFRVQTRGIIQRIDMTPDGATLVSAEYRPLGGNAYADPLVVVRDGATGKVRHELKLTKTGGILFVAISPDGKLVVSGSWAEPVIRVWDARTGKPIRSLEPRMVAADTVFRPDSKVLVSAEDHPPGIRLWNVETGATLNVLRGHSKRPVAVACSGDGKLLASGSDDQTARIWDAATGKPLAILEHDRPIFCVAFSPDGKMLATASARGGAEYNYTPGPAQVRLWDLASGTVRLTLPEQRVPVHDMHFTPDGKMLITGNWSGAIILWDLTALRNAAGTNARGAANSAND
jgi:WD40 repeat protein